ncbi:hypothetical protein VNO80_10699 [Phaseolus coccineus]|uniref:Uncharacterized protein n=1 Tax=Phaseolus coccineus TaxID=3886 RepID=A0AAN9N956_PHACN
MAKGLLTFKFYLVDRLYYLVFVRLCGCGRRVVMEEESPYMNFLHSQHQNLGVCSEEDSEVGIVEKGGVEFYEFKCSMELEVQHSECVEQAHAPGTRRACGKGECDLWEEGRRGRAINDEKCGEEETHVYKTGKDKSHSAHFHARGASLYDSSTQRNSSAGEDRAVVGSTTAVGMNERHTQRTSKFMVLGSNGEFYVEANEQFCKAAEAEKTLAECRDEGATLREGESTKRTSDLCMVRNLGEGNVNVHNEVEGVSAGGVGAGSQVGVGGTTGVTPMNSTRHWEQR